MGRRQGARSGAYLGRYVTDEQRSRRPIFLATLRAVAGWLFFRVARSSRINSDMLVARALKNSQLTDGESHAIYGTGHWQTVEKRRSAVPEGQGSGSLALEGSRFGTCL